MVWGFVRQEVSEVKKARVKKKKSLKWSHVSHNNKPRLNSSLNVSQENVLFKQMDLKFPAWPW